LIDEVDHDNETALHLAAYKGYAHYVEFLLGEGAMTTIVRKKGWIPIKGAIARCINSLI
jgi:ankyrin repeat protein